MRKHLFTELSHRPQAGIPILNGLFMIALSFAFRGESATTPRIGLFALGLALVLIGGAELLPRHSTMVVGLVRIAAYLSTFIGCLLVVLLWVGIHL
jgi:hypothetical protein